MTVRNKWHAFYSTLPVRPTRFHGWMTPLSLIAGLITFFPALPLMLNIVEETPVIVGLVVFSFFFGLFLFAHDQKWATYNARRAGLTWSRRKPENKWTHIKQ